MVLQTDAVRMLPNAKVKTASMSRVHGDSIVSLI
jgi:hypothetical protein